MTTADELGALQRAEAWGRAYALFARLYREGITAELAEEVAELPVLAPLLPEPFDASAAAAEHHDLFSLQVFPYGGVFLEPDGRVGGPTADVVRDGARVLGSEDEGGEAPDHLGHVLELLAALADADPRGGGERARRLLDHHLLWWLPAFVLAVREEGHAFWTLVAELTLDLAVDHRRGLGGEVAADTSPLPAASVPDLDAPATRLGDVATFLASPARSGLYLSSAFLRRTGRELEIPFGFGGRDRLLETMLGSAAEYDAFGRLVEALVRRAEEAREHHAAVAREAVELRAVATVWTQRIESTEELLTRMLASVPGG